MLTCPFLEKLEESKVLCHTIPGKSDPRTVGVGGYFDEVRAAEAPEIDLGNKRERVTRGTEKTLENEPFMAQKFTWWRDKLPDVPKRGDNSAVVGSRSDSRRRLSFREGQGSLHILAKGFAPHLKDALRPQPETKVQSRVEDLEIAPVRNRFADPALEEHDEGKR